MYVNQFTFTPLCYNFSLNPLHILDINMKKLFLLLLTFSTFLTLFLQARMIDGIALIVEGEPITTAEIRSVQRKFRLSKSKAIDALIQDRLQKVAMKDIAISEEMIDKKIEEIAANNHVSIKKMQRILKKSGTTWTQYRKSIDQGLRKEQFFQNTVMASIPEPSQRELKHYYNTHKKEFKIPSTLHLIEYASKTQKGIEAFLRTKKRKSITKRHLKKKTKTLSPDLLTTLLRTPRGGFTSFFNTGKHYIVYKVVSSSGTRTMPFEVAQNAVANRWRQTQQNRALKDYFKKLRTRANIQKLR